MKQCNVCKEIKSLDLFSFRNKQKGQYQSKCRECYNSYNKTYYNSGENQKQKDRVRAYKKDLRVRYQAWKSTQQCSVCGENAVECLDLHHIDPSTKEGELSSLTVFGSWDKILKEINKCTVLCANCHRKVHSGRITSVA